MIFETSRTVRLSETDATGIIYFTNLLKFTCEAFEAYLQKILDQAGKTFANSRIALPIIDVKGTFLAQITAGDHINITIKEIEQKRTSVVVIAEICKNETVVAKTKIVHVAIDKETGKKVSIDECEYLLNQESCTSA